MADSSINPTESIQPNTTLNDTASGSTSLNGHLQNAKDTAVSSAQSVMNSLQNNETVNRIANGPVAANVKDQAAKTSSEFQTLADSRTVPSHSTATGQTLTHYHSFFYNLLSWKNPRATGVAFASSLTLIVAARYLPILKWFFKSAYIILGCTALMEMAGKFLFNDGLTSKFRPRKYYTIPRETLEATLGDVEQLLNFFVIETQRVLFAENVYVTAAVFASALVSYWLIKLVPFWGLSLIGTTALYVGPLVYVSNKEAIDSALNSTGEIINAQTGQLRDITAQHTNNVTKAVKDMTSEYTSKAQEYIKPSRGSPEPTAVKTESSAIKTEPVAVNPTSFPSVPAEPVEKVEDTPADTPMLAS